MVEVTLYTRSNCHLCDVAKEAIGAVRAEGLEFDLREIDIESDPELVRKYGRDIPVIQVGGREIARHRLDANVFRTALHEGVASESGDQELASMTCVPCRGGVPPMNDREIERWLGRLRGGWKVVGSHHLEKEFRFPDFRQALDFTNAIGEIAEAEGHHPDIELGWGRVRVKIWTHKIDGLTESDFVLAAKIGSTDEHS